MFIIDSVLSYSQVRRVIVLKTKTLIIVQSTILGFIIIKNIFHISGQNGTCGKYNHNIPGRGTTAFAAVLFWIL